MMVFDIDGTILDMRHMAAHVLKSFDQNHGTCFFNNLTPQQITVHENRIYMLLEQLDIPSMHQEDIIHWYNTYRWLSEEILRSHHPFAGMLDIMHWFQMQPNTFIGVNTSRPEVNRLDTLRMLRKLGQAYNVRFSSNLINMNPFGWDRNVPEVKAAGIEYFWQSGFHLFAMVDSDPENLETVSRIDIQQEILLLGPEDILNIRPEQNLTLMERAEPIKINTPDAASYNPQSIQLAWQNITDRESLNRFLNSGIQWAEFSAELDPESGKVLMQQNQLSRSRHQYGVFDYMQYMLDLFRTMDRSIKIDLKEGGHLLDELFAMLEYYGFDDARLWFSADVEVIGMDGCKKLKKQYPTSILQCALDNLILNMDHIPETMDDRLKHLTDCGISRFSIKWHPKNLSRLKLYMDGLGLELHIDDVPDLEAFIAVVLLRPHSATAEFDFSSLQITDSLNSRMTGNLVDMGIKLPVSA